MPDALILDGNTMSLNTAPDDLVRSLEPVDSHVMLQTKADALCCTVSAAAITAKVARDALMVGLAAECPVYGWDNIKGYGSAAHRSALNTRGVTEYHRRSWTLMPVGLHPRLLSFCHPFWLSPITV